VTITRNGRDRLVVLSVEEYARLKRRDRQALGLDEFTLVIFDALINNADRKAGHVLLGADDHLWLIDHGVCFHVEDKLRTVIWDFAGQAIPEALLVGLRDLRGRLKGDERLRAAFAALLSAEEIAALGRRADRLTASGRFPLPGQERPYPWPLV
jgi:uncharacterized repeat protein (TIGR03843 family)